ncbi:MULTISPECIES: DUF4250 domain-containing protein [unclassified Clostridium]|uniref:DUF4250 domain-containing protein n=1 Tax=unclassified Clostridium TaxID=2614128 RepID=UPI00290D2EFA|nr:DUF4250 domain-containing protein [Clostridium sp.]MDU5105307.1 DUF4250 domain-containing protein [Clostridium sp.]
MDKSNYISMDTNILLSIVNMKLRDFYSNLDSLCEDMEVNKEDLKEKFNKIGYNYDETINQFR